MSRLVRPNVNLPKSFGGEFFWRAGILEDRRTGGQEDFGDFGGLIIKSPPIGRGF